MIYVSKIYFYKEILRFFGQKYLNVIIHYCQYLHQEFPCLLFSLQFCQFVAIRFPSIRFFVFFLAMNFIRFLQALGGNNFLHTFFQPFFKSYKETKGKMSEKSLERAAL